MQGLRVVFCKAELPAAQRTPFEPPCRPVGRQPRHPAVEHGVFREGPLQKLFRPHAVEQRKDHGIPAHAGARVLNGGGQSVKFDGEDQQPGGSFCFFAGGEQVKAQRFFAVQNNALFQPFRPLAARQHANVSARFLHGCGVGAAHRAQSGKDHRFRLPHEKTSFLYEKFYVKNQNVRENENALERRRGSGGAALCAGVFFTVARGAFSLQRKRRKIFAEFQFGRILIFAKTPIQ